MPKKRRKETLKPKKIMKIYCEGEKTEPSYILGYIEQSNSDSLKKVIELQPTRKNTPVELVEEACKAKKGARNLAGDVYWVVYDRESVAKYSDRLHASAYDKARANGINLVISNVCFEYWILLHFVDTSAPYSSYDDLFHKSDLSKSVKIACGKDYTKALDLFGAVKNSIDCARERAKKLNSRALEDAEANKNKPYHLNPYTNMNELLDAIDKFEST
jgi:hypothetical protein